MKAVLRSLVARLATIALTAVVVWLVWLAVQPRPTSGRPASRAAMASLPVRVIVSADTVTRPVSHSFLGLSTEYWTLPLWRHRLPLLEKVLAQVHPSGSAPLILRIGGDSADQSFWTTSRQYAPEWAFEITPRWLDEVNSLIDDTGSRLILDLNFITATPAIAAQWAAAATSGLPSGRIVGLEIGNEPDIYTRSGWLTTLKGGSGVRTLLPLRISAAAYAHDFGAYASALRSVARGIPLLGPAVADPALHGDWIRTLLTRQHPGLRTVTGHMYPYSACAFPKTSGYPTVARVLSEQASAGIAGALVPVIAVTHRAGLRFSLTELNSVTCGGRPGVSDTFASALWAPDALFELMRAGVDSVSLHVRAHTINAPFALTRHGLYARPLLYGLILFARTLGRDAHLARAQVIAPRRVDVKVWAVEVNHGTLHVLVIDKSQYPLRVWLQLPAGGPATVSRMVAASGWARSGITLGGRWLTRAGTWAGPSVTETLSLSAQGYRLAMPAWSAALVSARLAHPRTTAWAWARRSPVTTAGPARADHSTRPRTLRRPVPLRRAREGSGRPWPH